MSETTDTQTRKFVPVAPVAGAERDGKLSQIARTEKGTFTGDFYEWPNIADGNAPDFVVEKVLSHRAAIVVPEMAGPANKYQGFRKGEKGYWMLGKGHASGELVSPAFLEGELLKNHNVTDAAEREKVKSAFVAVLQRMDNVELNGEGYTESIMTGDGAKLTWGRGLGYAGGGYMAEAFSDFVNGSEAIRRDFLDHGIAMVDKKLHVVDTEAKKIRIHDDAADHFNGLEPADIKKNLLACIAQLTRKYGTQAATAQWKIIWHRSIYRERDSLVTAIRDGWPTELICFVIHAQMWGKFAGWSAFLKVGPVPKQVLRLEVDYTNYHTVENAPEGRGTYLLVPPKRVGGATPAPTMVNNLGHGYIQQFLEKWETEVDKNAKVQGGDVVFQIANIGKPGHHYYVLRGTALVTNPNEKYNDWVAEHQGKSMKEFLAEAAALSKKNELTKTRDYYIAAHNPKQMDFGMRPLVVMNAELHKKNFSKAIEVMAMAREAGITLASTQDQYMALLKHVNLEKYDAWIEKRHAYALDHLLREIKTLGYAETKNTRDWYASSTNQRKERFGLRPRVALDAILHKNEGPSSAWLLNDCGPAGITQEHTPDQMALIKQTLGIA